MNLIKLKDIMQTKDITAYRLSQLSGISAAGVSYILNGKRKCTLASSVRIANALKLTSKQIIDIFYKEDK
jgi:plasmid maintenance system antidote protein VapI